MSDFEETNTALPLAQKNPTVDIQRAITPTVCPHFQLHRVDVCSNQIPATTDLAPAVASRFCVCVDVMTGS